MLWVVVAAFLFAGAERAATLRMAASRRRAVASVHTIAVRSAERQLQQTREEDLRDWLIRLRRHHRMLEQKYLNAAARPWSSVPPDPAPPALPLP